MAIFQDVWVFAEKKNAVAELCAGGRTLGEQVSVLMIGDQQEAEQVIQMGADRVYLLGQPSSIKMLEDCTLTIADLVITRKPGLMLFGASKRCRLIAGRLAAKLRTSALTDVMEFVAEEGELKTRRMVYGGAAIRTEKACSKTNIALVGAGVFEKKPLDMNRHGEIEAIDFIEPDSRIKRKEQKAKKGDSVNLAAAKRAVVVGRGIAKQEDLKMIEEMAALIEAEIGCTRPMAEGVNWLPRERYIGVSGVMFKPEIYIGIGVSGQIQHMVGCNQARTIIAINKDKAAPIFSQADFGLVGDLYKVVPLLIEKLKACK